MVAFFWLALLGIAIGSGSRRQEAPQAKPVRLNENGYEIDDQGQLIHRIVSARVDGPIPKGWVVHHCDCNRRNNDPSNLIQLPWNYHTALHEEMYSKRVKYSKQTLIERCKREGIYV